MDTEHKTQLLDSARALITALETDNEQDIETHLTALTYGRDNNLFLEVGKLTRELHVALNNFNVDSRIADLTHIGIPDTRERLDYIINLTEQAAHRTLEVVDTTSDLTHSLLQATQAMSQRWQASTSNNLSTQDHQSLHHDLSAYFSSMTQHTETIQTNLSDITLAQGYQDLTGQVIRQVTDLVEEVETNLVRLIKIASEHQPLAQADSKTKPLNPIKAEGPQMNTADKPNIMADQDDVDDLLSSLGF